MRPGEAFNLAGQTFDGRRFIDDEYGGVYEHPTQTSNRTAKQDMSAIQEKLSTAMSDQYMSYEEKAELGALLREFNKNYKQLSNEDKNLRDSIKELVSESARLTNAVSKNTKQDGADASSGG